MTSEALFALGTGVSIGIVFIRLFNRMSPEGIERVAKSFAEQLSHAKEEAGQELARYREEFGRERAEWRSFAETVQHENVALVDRLLNAGQPAITTRAPTPIQAAPGPAPSANGGTDHQMLADKLRHIPGISAEKAADVASKILAGETEDLGLDPLTATIAEGIIKEETKVV